MGLKVYHTKLSNMKNLLKFKKEIKTWKANNCPSSLCKLYIKYAGLL